VAVDKGWHIYANPPGQEDLVPVQTTVVIGAKTKPDDVKIDYPEGTVMPDSVLGKYRVYENKVAIKATVRRAAGAAEPLEVTVKFQACSDKQCLLPVSKTLRVPSKDNKTPDGAGK
jgi:DsbC/DsbD-like thiol-disulfide interchange protein